MDRKMETGQIYRFNFLLNYVNVARDRQEGFKGRKRLEDKEKSQTPSELRREHVDMEVLTLPASAPIAPD